MTGNEYRAALETLLAALDASPSALRLDECNDWRLKGKRGHIYADPPGFLLVVHTGSARAWTSAKKRLAFCRGTQDGDAEGCLALDRLPTADEAIEIREILKIRKRTDYSAESLAAMTARLKRISHHEGTSGPYIQRNPSSLSLPPPTVRRKFREILGKSPSSTFPEALKPRGRQFGVLHRMLNIFVSEVGL